MLCWERAHGNLGEPIARLTHLHFFWKLLYKLSFSCLFSLNIDRSTEGDISPLILWVCVWALLFRLVSYVWYCLEQGNTQSIGDIFYYILCLQKALQSNCTRPSSFCHWSYCCRSFVFFFFRFYRHIYDFSCNLHLFFILFFANTMFECTKFVCKNEKFLLHI